MQTKVLIVDDHPAVREGLAVRISAQPDLEVCGEAADIPQAIEMALKNAPHVAIVDIQLKNGNGLDLIDRFKSLSPPVHVLIWSMFRDDLYAQRALRAGARGYINKECATGKIVEAIRCVREGKIFLADETSQRMLLQQFVAGGRDKPSGVESLSNRELEVFRMIGQGLTASQIAQRLHRSGHTVEAHRQAIKRKLTLKSAAELNRAAVQWTLESG
jgi:DNA-binding NarL/FixJ family response regulator